VDYEFGGVGIQDSSQGADLQEWTLTLNGDDFVVSAPNTAATTLFSRPGVTSLALAWDQNMNPFVAFQHGAQELEEDRTCTYWWFDTAAGQQVFTDLPAGSFNPRATLDDKRPTSLTSNDILLVYLRDRRMYLRQQRDRYLVEYLLQENVGKNIHDLGMGDNLRVVVSMDTQ
jgi:hypothetical protein